MLVQGWIDIKSNPFLLPFLYVNITQKKKGIYKRNFTKFSLF